MSSAGGEVSATRLRRNPLVMGLGLAPIVAALADVLVAGSATRWTAALVFVSPLGLILSCDNSLWPRNQAGKVSVEGRTVLWNGGRLARREEIERITHYRDVTRGTIVRLHLKNARDWRLAVKDADTAREVVRMLGLGSDRSTARLLAKSWFSSIPRWVQLLAHASIFGVLFGIAAAIHGATSNGPGAFFAALALFLAMFVALRFSPTIVEVGADALRVKWLWRKRIIPLADVIDVDPTTESLLAFTGDGGGTVDVSQYGVAISVRNELPIRIRFGRSDAEIGERNQLVERFREVRAAHDRGDEAIDTAFLARGGRDVTAWIEALRSGSAPEGGMRHAPIPIERFWQLIEDASARAVDRAAAAVAVGRSARPEQRDRVRIAADQTADPALREALERAIDERAEEEALAAALLAVEKAQR